MKKLIAFSLLALCAPAQCAWEFEGNPDKVPSIGINYTGTFYDGKNLERFTDLSGSYLYENKIDNGKLSGLAIDGRFPVNHNVTINASIGHIFGSEDETNSNYLGGTNFKSRRDISGTTFNIGIRFYATE